MEGTLVYEAWGDHGALLIKPPRSRGRVAPPEPRSLVLEKQQGFTLELGGELPEVQLAFETYGTLSASGDNAVLVFHALTGSAHLAGTYTEETLQALSPLNQAFGPEGWWDQLVGPGRLLDPGKHYVICANHVGSCYGSTGTLSIDPRTGQAYGKNFPQLTVRDLAKLQAKLVEQLGVKKVTVLGGSLGGMVALEFALLFPERVAKLVVLAAPAVHSPWARAFNRLSREAILSDAGYLSGEYLKQPAGLQMARAIAMLSYRSPSSFIARWGDEPELGESYLIYQGEKFARRFDANAYLVLSNAMDTHDVGRGRGGIEAALAPLVGLPSLFVGIDTDILYTAPEVRELARMSGGRYAEITSPHGHDSFLIETDQVERILEGFI
ncbi:MAG: homoserine O-acetyltransferase [Deinococcus sp.]|nr:homoserine O-acetyltransferase [Deinococcus sp.]